MAKKTGARAQRRSEQKAAPASVKRCLLPPAERCSSASVARVSPSINHHRRYSSSLDQRMSGDTTHRLEGQS